MNKNLAILFLALLSIITIDRPKNEHGEPAWMTIERQRSTDPEFDGLYFTLYDIDDNGEPFTVFIESDTLRKAWNSKTPTHY